MKNDSWAEVRKLEESLLMPDVRQTPARLDQLLADDFLEIGSSGEAFGKASVLAALPHGAPVARRMDDFEVRELAHEITLVTYRVSRSDGRESRRSSIWQRRDGRWQMVFHQGTPIAFPRS